VPRGQRCSRGAKKIPVRAVAPPAPILPAPMVVIERVDGLGWAYRANLQRGHTTQITSFQKKTYKFKTFSYGLLVHGPILFIICLTHPYCSLIFLKFFGSLFAWPITCIITIIFLVFAFTVTNMWDSEFTIRNANKGQLLKPEERGHSSKTIFFKENQT